MPCFRNGGIRRERVCLSTKYFQDDTTGATPNKVFLLIYVIAKMKSYSYNLSFFQRFVNETVNVNT